ncbi:MAG TPA: hypothetical protein ENG85_03515 [Bacteroidetes bacterium]|nr:hypothetical protein [Bacteroidota bacterium]
MRKFVFFAISMLFALLLASCSKSIPAKYYSARDVAGTYKGSLVTGNLKHDGTADVSAVNDSIINIHCYDSVGFDTTFVMELYQNGDSVMLCSTGQDFYNQYGHYMTGQHHMYEMGNMMGGSSGMTDWQQHISSQHQAGDMHYGDFDMEHGTFNYWFDNHSGAQNGTTFYGKRQ